MKTRLPMKSSFKNESFFKLIERILNSNNELCKLRDDFKSRHNKYDLILNHGYYELTTKGQNRHTFFTLSKRFGDREYIFRLIFENASGAHNLYMEIDCLGGPIELGRIPPFMTDAMKAVSSCEHIICSELGTTTDVIEASESNIDKIISQINSYSYDAPMILATAFKNSRAYDIDENKLLKHLRGFAYIVLVDEYFTDILKRKAKLKIEHGATLMLHKDGHKSVKNSHMLRGTNVNEVVFDFVSNRSQGVIIPEPKANAIITSDEVKELKKQFIQEKEKNAELNQRINEVTCEKKAMEKALEQANKGSFGIIKPNEIYDGEVTNLIVAALKNEKERSNPRQKRKLDLIDEIIKLNPKNDNGEKYLEELKNLLYNGVGLNSAGLASLTKLGVQVERDSTHYVMTIFDKYQFAMSKSPSDDRSGKNLYSDIKNTLCVYN